MGKSVGEYINKLEAPSGLHSIMTVEHRSNNTKRDFLFCNKLQGKHIPVTPSKALDLFDELLYEIAHTLDGYNILVVGFAETATAIGAHIGEYLTSCRFHTQTTRENCVGVEKLIEFSEEHSHATEQYLYGDRSKLPKFDYVLFVEDEISTGKTILNFIVEFKKLDTQLKFGVASICNWQNSENKEIFKANNIDTFALITGSLKDENVKMDVQVKADVSNYAADLYSCDPKKIRKRKVSLIDGDPFIIERTGKFSGYNVYDEILGETFRVASKFIEDGEASNILVLGTEEFMYYPIVIGDMLDGYKRNVKTHSTTRSSIDILEGSIDIKNELVNKSKLHSAYDKDRVTYVYNLAKYDRVFIVTDSNTTDDFINDIVAALVYNGNREEDIMLINITK